MSNTVSPWRTTTLFGRVSTSGRWAPAARGDAGVFAADAEPRPPRSDLDAKGREDTDPLGAVRGASSSSSERGRADDVLVAGRERVGEAPVG